MHKGEMGKTLRGSAAWTSASASLSIALSELIILPLQKPIAIAAIDTYADSDSDSEQKGIFEDGFINSGIVRQHQP
jgi:hypothetical protein